MGSMVGLLTRVLQSWHRTDWQITDVRKHRKKISRYTVQSKCHVNIEGLIKGVQKLLTVFYARYMYGYSLVSY